MGNVFGINCTAILPWDQLIPVCFPHEGASRWKSINDLQDDLERLKAIRDGITRTIRESLKMRPLEQENQWLQQVETLEGKVEKLKADYYRLHPRPDNTQEAANTSVDIVESSERRPPEQVIQNQEAANISVPIVEILETIPPGQVIQNSKCFCGYSPNCIKSYRLWRKIQQMDRDMLELLKQKPDLKVERPRLAPPQRVPVDPTTGMQVMLDKIWSHIENQQDKNIIGLYGMGGVGKTTLLKAINNKLCSPSQNYDLLLWIVVSKSPNLVDIQNHIGEKIGSLGNAWKRKRQGDKATDIYNVLYGKKYILLLDDIWDRFDLTKIGIPLPDLQNKSIVIFTTRSLQLCGQMRATTEIQVQCLNDEEAWNLFKENVGEKALNGDQPDILGLAKDVMRECGGLPLALIVIGRAMALKTTVHDWKHAIQVLQHYAAKFSPIKDEVFTPLKYSYDNLNVAIRFCFLYCSLYAEDEEISKSKLVDKWICEDFLGGSNTLDNARSEGYSYINILVHASLLEPCSVDKVKMHDVIRDMALWIAGDGFYVKVHARLAQIPNDVKWEHVKKLSLMKNHIRELNNGPTEFTKLETILFRRGGLSSINNEFLKFVPNLKVVDLSYNYELRSLPKEFCELVNLQYLNLKNTNLEELLNEFQKLVKLKYLNLRNTKLHTVPEGVLLGMKALSVFRCDSRVHFYCNVFLGEELVKEFKGLTYLQDVTMSTHSKAEVSNMTSSLNLLKCITRLTLMYFEDSKSLDILFLKELKHLQNLRIEELKDVEKIVVGEGQGLETWTMINIQNDFNTLRSIYVSGCDQLTNLSWLVLFPNIESMVVSDCPKVQTLVSENEYKHDNEPFAKLRKLHLSRMWKLESIYFTSLSFPCLNSLTVNYGCETLKKLPFDSNSCDRGRGIVIKGGNEWWNELQWEDEATRAAFSSRFDSRFVDDI